MKTKLTTVNCHDGADVVRYAVLKMKHKTRQWLEMLHVVDKTNFDYCNSVKQNSETSL